MNKREALTALRDYYLERALTAGNAMQRVALRICEQIELVMCSEGTPEDRFAVQQRLDSFMPDSGIRIY